VLPHPARGRVIISHLPTYRPTSTSLPNPNHLHPRKTKLTSSAPSNHPILAPRPRDRGSHQPINTQDTRDSTPHSPPNPPISLPTSPPQPTLRNLTNLANLASHRQHANACAPIQPIPTRSRGNHTSHQRVTCDVALAPGAIYLQVPIGCGWCVGEVSLAVPCFPHHFTASGLQVAPRDGGGWWRPLCRPIGIENRDVLGNLEGKGPNEMRPCSSAIWGGASGPRHSLLILREGGEERRRVYRSQNSIETSQCAWSGVLHGYPFFSAAYPAADAAYPATLTSHDPFR